MPQSFSKIWIAITLVVLVAGGIFAWQYLQLPKDEIKTGKIEVDYDNFKQTQGDLPGGGHQPWLADPKLVAQAESLAYGFYYGDFETAKEITLDLENGIAKYEVLHKNKTYVIIVIQPIVGENKVWTISEIQEKGTEDETANQKTYRNDEYGFEFKYPSNINISYEGETGFELQPLKIAFQSSFQITVWDNPKELGIKEYFVQNSACILNQGICVYLEQGYPLEDFEVGSVRWTTNAKIFKPSHFFVILSTPDKEYSILEFINLWPVDTEKTKVFNQILSTFRFIEGETVGPTVSCEYQKGDYEFRIYDSEGNITGLVNGKVKQEISRSVYANGDVTIYFPQDYYEYELFSLKEGNYQLERSSVQEGGEIIFKAVNIPIFPGQTHRYKISWKTLAEIKSGTELLIDNDGDGSFEKTIPINGTEFTCEEFIAQTKK